LAVAPDGSWLASTGFDGQVRIWDVQSARRTMSVRTGHTLNHVLTGRVRVVAAGDRGPYFLAVVGC
jgi:WD40 repeat protein